MNQPPETSTPSNPAKMPLTHPHPRRIATFTASLIALLYCHIAAAQTPAPGLPARQPASTIPSSRNYLLHIAYQTQFADYLQTMQGKPCDIIFIGDSITEQWRWGAGKPVWDKFYEPRALDFGQGGDTTQNALWRLKNLPIDGFNFKAAVILIGTNNFTDTPDNIAAGVRAVIDATFEKFPRIKVILVSILPNARATAKMAAANTLIRPFADNKSIYYLDLASKFTPVGNNWLGIGPDKLHLTQAGYQTWAAELNNLLPQVTAHSD